MNNSKLQLYELAKQVAYLEGKAEVLGNIANANYYNEVDLQLANARFKLLELALIWNEHLLPLEIEGLTGVKSIPIARVVPRDKFKSKTD